MKKSYTTFGFLTGFLCVSLLMLLLFLGFEYEKREKEAAAADKGSAATSEGAALIPIDGPPTKENIEAVLRGDQGSERAEQPQKPKETSKPASPSPGARIVRRSAPTQRFVPGEALDLYLHISKREEIMPDSLVIRDILPTGWSLKEVAASTTAMTQAPESGTSDALEFRWEKPEKFPITVKYSVHASEESESVSLLKGDATWVYDEQPNTSSLAVMKFYAENPTEN